MRTVFFCGHKSRYGAAHFDPVVEAFDVSLVVVATEERWLRFAQQLSGEISRPPALVERVRAEVKNRLRRTLATRNKIFRLDPSSDIDLLCSRRNIPLLRVDDVNDAAFIEKVRSYNPTLLMSAAYPQLFAKTLLEVPRIGAINFHPSLLPRCRGAHPVFWAIASGEDRSGVTAHFMTEDLDKGDMVAQIEIPISESYYSHLYDKVVRETPQLVRMVRDFLQDGKRQPVRQDSARATYFRNNRKIHSCLVWNVMSGRDIHNLIRTELAYCFFRNKRIGIRRATLVETNRNLTNKIVIEAGRIVDIKDGEVVVKTTDSCLVIRAVSLNGREQSSLEWARLNEVIIGEKFC